MSIPATTSKKDSPKDAETPQLTPFGSLTPFAEPLWYTRNKTPFYKDTHRRLRAAVRRYIDEEILPNAFEWEQAGQVPDSVGCFSSSEFILTFLGMEKTCRAWISCSHHWSRCEASWRHPDKGVGQLAYYHLNR